MSSIIINLPDSVDIKALIKAFEKIGINPEYCEEKNLVPLDTAIKKAFPDKTIQEIIGGMLKVSREDAKLTQKALADIISEDKSNISAMERGKRPISKKMAQKLGKALNVPYHTFL